MKKLLPVFILICGGLLTAQTTSIHDIQYSTDVGTGSDCYPSALAGTSVNVTGIVTAVKSGGQFYVQDADSAWSGVYVYDSGLDCAVGDSVSFTADVSEYYGMTELSGLSDSTIHSSGHSVTPVMVNTGDITAACSDTSELYESVLVTLTNVTVTQAANSYGEWYVDDGTGECQLDDPFFSVTPAVGDFFDSITGVVDYSYSTYAVNPRSADDIVTTAIGPTLVSVDFAPQAPLPSEDVLVTVNAYDDKAGLAVDLYVAYDGGGFAANTMTDNADSTYTYTIPAQSEGTTAEFYAILTDSDDNADTSATYNVTFETPSEITPIADIQDTTGVGSDTSSFYGQTVTISGIVTAEFWGSASNRYMFVQDAPGAWNGIMLFEYGGWDSFDFNSSTGIVHSVAEGDSVTVTGTVDEYNGMTELGSVTDFTIHGHALNMIPPSVLTSDMSPDLEAYEGCLVEVDNATVSNPDANYGEWTITDATAGEIKLDDRWDYYFKPASGQNLAKVVGCIEYSYGEYKIQPRLARDVVEAAGEDVRLQRIQQVLYSDLMKAGVDALSDTSYMRGDTVSLYGIVTMPTGLSYAGAGVKFIFQDTLGGPWSSILSYDPDSTTFPVLYEGDVIHATGYVSEYQTAQSNMTELFVTEPVDIIDAGQPEPEVPVVNTGDLRWPTTAEQWGTVMVGVEDAVVMANDLQYGEWIVDDGTGGVHIDDDSDSLNAWQNTYGRPPVGTPISSAEGWIYHHYGSYADSSAYKLEPLYASDIVFGAGGPPSISDPSRMPCVPGPDDAVTVIAQIEDNSTITSAVVYYSTDGTNYSTADMTNTDTTAWEADIPATGTDGAHVDYYISATDDGVDQAGPVTSTYPSDIEVIQLGYTTNTGDLTISDVQMTDWPRGDSPYNGCEVTLTGTVTADTAQVNSAYGTYAIQSETGQWNGIIMDPITDVSLTRGDNVTVTGMVEDYDPAYHFKFDNNTKLINVSSVTVNSTGNSIAAMAVGTSDLAQDADEVESYEGVLVTLSNVTVSSVNSYDWSVDDGSGSSCLIDDDMANSAAAAYLAGLEVGTVLSHVTGVFNYSFGTYKIQVRDMGDIESAGVDDNFVTAPMEYALYQNYPNPFNPETRIKFDLKEAGQVKLIVYNVLGYKVRTLVDDSYSSGQHVVNWDGRNDAGLQVSSGMYIYRIKAGSFIDQGKMLLIR